MFGHQDEPKQAPTDTPVTPTNEPVSDGTLGSSNPVDLAAAQEPHQPVADTAAIEAHETDGLTTDTGSQSTNDDEHSDDAGNALLFGSPSDTPTNTDTLLDIKQQALQQLSPLVGHLDQSPEEKFRTTMMMIQASDNKDLLKTAYDAAQQIADEKARAQALLDVINEINYFTQHQA